MAEARPGRRGGRFRVLDKDLGRITHAEVAQLHAMRPVWRLGLIVLAFVALILLAVGLSGAGAAYVWLGAGLVVAAWLGLAIGSNDVANSLGPAVGAGAIGLVPGLILVALAEVAGAVLAGGAVAQRLAGGIVDPAVLEASGTGALVMLAALTGAACWITLATGIGLPVSTSHSIVGGIAGAGTAAYGLSGVDWASIGRIALTWVAAPVLAGFLAGALVILLRRKVLEAPDRARAARLWLPGMVGLMCGLFTIYLTRLLDLGLDRDGAGLAMAALAGGIGWITTRRGVTAEIARGGKSAARTLLRPALLVSVVIMGFAHGANDVGNVAGPLSVILGGARTGGYGMVPGAVLLAAGMTIALGTMLFGARLVSMVGSGITRLNAGRAFCVTLATAIVVIGASGSGLPVSTTHVAVGGVFGVGFAREWQDRRRREAARPDLPEEEQSRRRLIRRSHVATILAAWAVTLPMTALMAGAAAWLMLLLSGA